VAISAWLTRGISSDFLRRRVYVTLFTLSTSCLILPLSSQTRKAHTFSVFILVESDVATFAFGRIIILIIIAKKTFGTFDAANVVLLIFAYQALVTCRCTCLLLLESTWALFASFLK
jgi:hypothetical protein